MTQDTKLSAVATLVVENLGDADPWHDFALESALRYQLSKTWPPSALAGQKVHVLTEFRVGAVVPDLLVVTDEPTPASLSALKGLTSFECHALAMLLSKKRATPQELSKLLYARVDRVTEALIRLQRRGLIRSASRSFVFRRGSFPLGVEITAVEVKLRRWKDAVKQAVAYLAFANRSYVALPHKTLERDFLPILDSCIQNQIGLVSVIANGAELIIEAPRQFIRNADWLWTVARAITRNSYGGEPSTTVTALLERDQRPLSTTVDG